MKDNYVSPAERARVKAKFESHLISVQAAQQAAEIASGKVQWRERIKSHDSFWTLDPGDTIRGYKITKPSFIAGDDTRGQNGDD